jgi:hypothetical protein
MLAFNRLRLGAAHAAKLTRQNHEKPRQTWVLTGKTPQTRMQWRFPGELPLRFGQRGA